MKRLILILALLLAAGRLEAQVLNQTTLATALAPTDTTVVVAGGTPINAGYYLVIDGETMNVVSNSGLTSVVSRTFAGLNNAHGAGAIVYAGPPSSFSRVDPSSSCDPTHVQAPWINITTGFVYKCSNGGTWVLVSSFASAVASTGVLTSAAFPLLAPNGTAASPSYSFANATSIGAYTEGSSFFVSTGGVLQAQFYSNLLRLGSGAVYAWSSSTNPSVGSDTGLSRMAAGTVAFGNGTQADTSGGLIANSIVANANGAIDFAARVVFRSTSGGILNINATGETIGSAIKVDALPTISSGTGTGVAVTAGSTPFAGSVNVGTVAPGTVVVHNYNGTSFPSAPFCIANDTTTALLVRAQSSTTQLTLTSAGFTASDIVSYICVSSK